ncbi:hypothetical protein PoB_002204100 [Plakobranchus ocellatus]|uniref:Uncharacterized protein n=1 Tax=Plakobranchus ocellatus TaxID=259542 RepID=A0AAV3ZI04_9GAST|nr:hypothetical protein PoB_002204100 [Plakobranchus ocellatus]
MNLMDSEFVVSLCEFSCASAASSVFSKSSEVAQGRADNVAEISCGPICEGRTSLDLEYIIKSPSTSDTGPVEFVIHGSGKKHIDLAKTYLHVRVKVTKSDGGDVTDADSVAPTNFFAQALFSQEEQEFLNQCKYPRVMVNVALPPRLVDTALLSEVSAGACIASRSNTRYILLSCSWQSCPAAKGHRSGTWTWANIGQFPAFGKNMRNRLLSFPVLSFPKPVCII